MATENVRFSLPNTPEEFGVDLPPADLRRINFSALEFPTIRRSLIEYIKTYYPDTFNDFVAQNGIIMILELVSYAASLLSTRSDVIADDSFLPTAQDPVAVDNHLALINKSINRQTPAVVEVEVTVTNPVASEIRIPARTVLNAPGPDGNSVTYELFRAPNDFTSYISIPPNKRGVIGWAIEGRFAEPVVYVSAGGPSQQIEITDDDILDSPITVVVSNNNVSTTWKRISIIERALPNDEVYEVRFTETGMIIITGDDNAGRALLSGETVTITYRTGGGIRGRISSNAINRTDFIAPQPPASAPVEVLFRNTSPSMGGLDKETLAAAKKRAPREASTIGRATSGEDYAILSGNYSHPVYGSVLKSTATVRTSLNANLVELYILAAGPGDSPVVPSIGLKRGLESYFEDIKVLTDEVRVLDGAVKPIRLDANVIIDRNAVPGIVKANVDKAISNFFSIDKFDMGEGFYLSNLYEAIQKIDGVKFVAIFEPADDIIPTKAIGTSGADGVGFNEVIVLGEKNLRFFFEST